MTVGVCGGWGHASGQAGEGWAEWQPARRSLTHALCGPASAKPGANMAPSTGTLDRTSLAELTRGTATGGCVLDSAPPNFWVIVEHEKSLIDLTNMKRETLSNPRDMRPNALHAAEHGLGHSLAQQMQYTTMLAPLSLLFS